MFLWSVCSWYKKRVVGLRGADTSYYQWWWFITSIHYWVDKTSEFLTSRFPIYNISPDACSSSCLRPHWCIMGRPGVHTSPASKSETSVNAASFYLENFRFAGSDLVWHQVWTVPQSRRGVLGLHQTEPGSVRLQRLEWCYHGNQIKLYSIPPFKQKDYYPPNWQLPHEHIRTK